MEPITGRAVTARHPLQPVIASAYWRAAQDATKGEFPARCLGPFATHLGHRELLLPGDGVASYAALMGKWTVVTGPKTAFGGQHAIGVVGRSHGRHRVSGGRQRYLA